VEHVLVFWNTFRKTEHVRPFFRAQPREGHQRKAGGTDSLVDGRDERGLVQGGEERAWHDSK
jgi:hypothetical protein